MLYCTDKEGRKENQIRNEIHTRKEAQNNENMIKYRATDHAIIFFIHLSGVKTT